MSSHAPMPEYEDEYVKERDALLAKNQRLCEKAQRVLDSFATTGFEEGSECLLALCDLREALAAVGEE